MELELLRLEAALLTSEGANLTGTDLRMSVEAVLVSCLGDEAISGLGDGRERRSLSHESQ